MPFESPIKNLESTFETLFQEIQYASILNKLKYTTTPAEEALVNGYLETMTQSAKSVANGMKQLERFTEQAKAAGQ